MRASQHYGYTLTIFRCFELTLCFSSETFVGRPVPEQRKFNSVPTYDIKYILIFYFKKKVPVTFVDEFSRDNFLASTE